MSSILPEILLLNVVKIYDSIYISPNHDGSVTTFIYLFYLFIYLKRNQFGQGQLKMLFSCIV